MLHTLHNKIQRVSNLIAEYDEDESNDRNPNPALHVFVQKVKLILDGKTETTRNDGLNYSNLDSNENDIVSASSSSPQQINAGVSNYNPSVIEALGNHVVLTEIFKCGGYHDLKNFRLINKQWQEIANSAIAKRRLWMLNLRNRLSGYHSNRNNALLKLIYCIEEGEGSFPLTAIDFFYIESYNTLNKASLHRIYNLIGPNIKHVEFHDFGSLTMNEFQDLLVNKMPNVDHISAGKIVFTDQEECIAPINLPHLKTIKFMSYKPFTVLPYYEVLLRAAKNLQEIQDFRVELTDIVIATEKLHCIQTFRFVLEQDTALCDQFSNLEPKLTALSITRNYFDIVLNEEVSLTLELEESLKRILFSSKDTLQHLQCLPCILPVDFELPKFPNLEFLTVRNDVFRDDTDHIGRVFPPGCDVNEIFPNVHTVLMDVYLYGVNTLRKYFPDQAFASVKTLAFQGDFEVGVSLKTIFPNVSHAKFMEYYRISVETEDMRFPGGFSFELDNQIESLEFHQCLVADARSERTSQLDALFTGVPPNVCKNLLKVHNDCKSRDEEENVEFVKEFIKLVQPENYMFRNCEGLRRLKIIFNDNCNCIFRRDQNSDENVSREDVESWNAVISPVSCVYGFSLMPNLEEVIIGYDHYLPNAAAIAHVLQPLAEFPYVKIVHEPTLEVY